MIIITFHRLLVDSTSLGGKIWWNWSGSFVSRSFFSPPKREVHSHLSPTLYTRRLTPKERTTARNFCRCWEVLCLVLLLSSCKYQMSLPWGNAWRWPSTSSQWCEQDQKSLVVTVLHTVKMHSAKLRNHHNPFTPESDQCQNSPAASQKIWHHTVWRTWLFIAYTQMKSDYTTHSRYITHTIAFWKVGRIHFLSSGVKGLIQQSQRQKWKCSTYLIPFEDL